jgi:hypothetical protein
MIFVAARNSWGYGHFRVGEKVRSAHRVAYELWIGPIPEGMDVLHHCDQRACCNVDHLYTGTDQDNVRDREERNPIDHRGEQNGRAILNNKKVLEIKILLAERRLTYSQIADQFSVSVSTIGDIVYKHSWSHIPWPTEEG